MYQVPILYIYILYSFDDVTDNKYILYTVYCILWTIWKIKLVLLYSYGQDNI